jgi:predicted amidohydrolase
VLHANLADTADYVEQAKEQGADIVCFPEYYLQGILNEGRQVCTRHLSNGLGIDMSLIRKQYLSLSSRHLEDAVADLARTHEIAITGTIVHGTSSKLPSIPVVSPFGEARAENTGTWTRYIQDAQDSMGDTSHLTLLNEAFFFDAEGKRRGSYVKKNLWHPERYVTTLPVHVAELMA